MYKPDLSDYATKSVNFVPGRIAIVDIGGNLKNSDAPVADGNYTFYNDGTVGNVISMSVKNGMITGITKQT